MPCLAAVAPDLRKLLEASGYVWEPEGNGWVHPRSLRALNVEAAARLSVEQVRAWIDEGRDRKPML
jgi:hypothetical protein